MYVSSFIAFFVLISNCEGSPSENCQDTEERYYVADDTKCNRFHMCEAGNIITELQCEEGLYFDGSLQQCSTTHSHCVTPEEDLKDIEQPVDQHKTDFDTHLDAEAVVLGREAQLAKGNIWDPTSTTDGEALALGHSIQEVNRLRLIHAELIAAHAAAEAAILQHAARKLQLANGHYLHPSYPSLTAYTDAEALLLGRAALQLATLTQKSQSSNLATHGTKSSNYVIQHSQSSTPAGHLSSSIHTGHNSRSSSHAGLQSQLYNQAILLANGGVVGPSGKIGPMGLCGPAGCVQFTR